MNIRTYIFYLVAVIFSCTWLSTEVDASPFELDIKDLDRQPPVKREVPKKKPRPTTKVHRKGTVTEPGTSNQPTQDTHSIPTPAPAPQPLTTLRAEQPSPSSVPVVIPPPRAQDVPGTQQTSTTSRAIAKIIANWQTLLPATVNNAPGLATAPSDGEKHPYPAVRTTDGRTILFAPAGALSSPYDDPAYLDGHHLKVIVPANTERDLLISVLKEAGYSSISEHTPLVLGTDPKLTIITDLRVATPNDHTALYLNLSTTECLPRPLTDVLDGKGIRFVEFCEQTVVNKPQPGIRLKPIRTSDQCALFDTLMESLSIPWETHRSLALTTLNSPEAATMVADRYREDNGTRYVVSCQGTDATSLTSLRILAVTGSRVIILRGSSSFESAITGLLRDLNRSVTLKRYTLKGPGMSRTSLELSGYLNDGKSPGLLLTTGDVETPLLDLGWQMGDQLPPLQ